MEDLVNEQAATPALRRIRGRLLRLKAPIDRQIREYPTPIAGCDAQFNYLLDERRRLAHNLNRLDEIEGGTPGEQERALEAFVNGSDYAVEDSIR
jgi:hypothetical protein